MDSNKGHNLKHTHYTLPFMDWNWTWMRRTKGSLIMRLCVPSLPFCCCCRRHLILLLTSCCCAQPRCHTVWLNRAGQTLRQVDCLRETPSIPVSHRLRSLECGKMIRRNVVPKLKYGPQSVGEFFEYLTPLIIGRWSSECFSLKAALQFLCLVPCTMSKKLGRWQLHYQMILYNCPLEVGANTLVTYSRRSIEGLFWSIHLMDIVF